MHHGESSRKEPGATRRRRWWRSVAAAVAAVLLAPVASYAQASPWENAVNVLMVSFTGPIARGLRTA
jgi:type IV secretory pathway VirB2 component (pilin)